MSDLVPVSHAPTLYPDAVYQRAFHTWAWECDRNCALTARRVSEVLAAEAAVTGNAPEPAPSDDTIRYWMRRDDWPGKVHEVLATDNTAAALYQRQIGTHLIMYDNVLLRYAEIITLPLSTPGILGALTKIGEQLQKTLRHVAPVEAPPPQIEPERRLGAGPARTREEIRAEQLDRIRRQKQPRHGKT